MNDLNLKPPRSANEARELGIKGGKASGEARRKKRIMSQILGEFLVKKFKIEIDGREEEMTGEKLVNRAIKEVLLAGGGPAVSLMKEIREATEGSKVELFGPISIGFPPEPPKPEAASKVKP